MRVMLLRLIKGLFLAGNIPKPLALFEIPIIQLKPSDGNKTRKKEGGGRAGAGCRLNEPKPRAGCPGAKGSHLK